MSGGIGPGTDRLRLWHDTATGEFGLQVRLRNETGANSVKGELVKADSGVDMSFEQCAADDLECIGVVYEAGIADGSDVWVWTGHGTVCQVLLKDATAATRGYWVKVSDTAGRADATTAAAPGVVVEHFREIGHCLESQGSGTDVLARILFHTL